MSDLRFAAFYADCEHEVKPITHDNRVCLTYHLSLAEKDKNKDKSTRRQAVVTAPVYEREVAAAAEILKATFRKAGAPTKLAWLLEHQYSAAGLSFAGLIGSPKIWDRGAALTSTLHWFETELLTQEENLIGLMAVNRELLSQAERPTRADRIVLDMDSSESPVHGTQEGSAYNGHFESVCYHPLFLFNEHGDCLGATLRPGNVHSVEDWEYLLVPEIERQQAECKRVAFRADAAFAKPEIYDALEQRDVDYAIRIPANKNLEAEIEDILFRPPGRPSHKPLVRYKSFQYQAESWTTPRRIVAKVEHHQGELFPRVGFIVTNMSLPSRSVVRFYNKRGTAEQWIKEGKQATHWTRLSCHRFRANEVRLQLSVLAYNLGNLWRRVSLPERIKSWSLTSLQHRLVKTGGRLVKHARYYWLLLAEGHLHDRLFADMLRRIWALPVPGG
ncbi:MAG TPA: IS1380 family transposase [Vicinamibacterales bacterium]|nr:IS1380 family transposase [Vicinamibacterales bacterium]